LDHSVITITITTTSTTAITTTTAAATTTTTIYPTSTKQVGRKYCSVSKVTTATFIRW